MKDYLQGWKNVKDVYIPPVKQKGFKENVIIRKYMPAKKVERIVMEMEEDDATVFVPMDEDYDDDRTVIVPEGIPGFVMIKRLKTGEIIKVAQDEFFIGKQVGKIRKKCMTILECRTQKDIWGRIMLIFFNRKTLMMLFSVDMKILKEKKC